MKRRKKPEDCKHENVSDFVMDWGDGLYTCEDCGVGWEGRMPPLDDKEKFTPPDFYTRKQKNV